MGMSSAGTALRMQLASASNERQDARRDNVRAFPVNRGVRSQPPQPSSSERMDLRLLVIDPRSLTRDCLVAAMESTHGIGKIIAVASVEDAHQALAAIDGVDAALLNLATDPFDADVLAALISTLRAAGSVDVVMLLTGLTDPAHAAAALRVGIQGFLSSDTPFALTLDAIRLVSLGWMVYPAFELSSLVSRTATIVESAPRAGDVGLTPRQQQVLQGLRFGMTNKDIAAQLAVSERTVKAHVQELMRRLGASNRTQVVALMFGRERSHL
jgi:DNA-binding NarL/FixJ family response regulator